MHSFGETEGLHVAEAMGPCFFAGMADYYAHLAFTQDVEGRFASIAKKIVLRETQIDNVSDFETLVQ